MSLVRRRRHGPPAEHANVEATDVGATAAATLLPYYDTINDDAVCITASITTTKRCCIVVVTVCVLADSPVATEIQRGGVDRTKETTVSATRFCSNGKYAHLQYTTEVLDPGTYTYNLVNISGGILALYGAVIKIVAVS